MIRSCILLVKRQTQVLLVSGMFSTEATFVLTGSIRAGFPSSEHIIRKHPSIQGCLMFGRSEFQTGIIIEPVAAKAFDPKDLNKLAEFRNEIWLVALLFQ